MVIERFEQREGIDPRPSRDYSMPGVVDVGGAIRGIGRSLMQAAEPELRRKAEEDAIADVGSAGIVKDAAGNYVRPEPKGRGLAYAAAFDRAADIAYAGAVQNDVEDKLTELGIEHENDPEKFKEAAVGYVEGILEKTNPRVRAELDVAFTREVGQRYRGIATQAANLARSNTIKGIASQIEANQAKAARALSLGGDDALAEAKKIMDRNKALYGSLVELKALNADGSVAEQDKDILELGDLADYAASEQGLQNILPTLNSMTDEQLQWWQMTGQTQTYIEQGAPMKEGALKTALPSKKTWSVVGQQAGQILAFRDQERQRQLQAEKEAREEADRNAQLVTSAQILSAINAGNKDPYSGFTEDQVAAEESTRITQGGGRIAQRLATKEGRHYELTRFKQTGVIANGTDDALEVGLAGDNFQGFAEWAQNMRQMHTGPDNRATGELWYQRLPARIRAALEAESRARRLGVPLAARQGMMKTLLDGEADLSSFDAQSKVGKTYPSWRAGHIANAFKIGESQASVNPQLMKDFDETFPFMLQLHGGDARKAGEATAAAIRNGYDPNPNFMGGVAPRILTKNAIDDYALNRIPDLADRRFNPMGAKFGDKTVDGRPRVLLKQMVSNQRDDYGRYQLVILTPEGKPQGIREVNLSALWGRSGPPRRPVPKPGTNLTAAQRNDWIRVWDNQVNTAGSGAMGWQMRRRGDVLANPRRYSIKRPPAGTKLYLPPVRKK